MHNSFLAWDDFCRVLITFANSLDPEQDQNMSVRSGPKLFDTLIMFLKEFSEKVYFEKSQQMTTKTKLPSMQKNYYCTQPMSIPAGHGGWGIGPHIKLVNSSGTSGSFPL